MHNTIFLESSFSYDYTYSLAVRFSRTHLICLIATPQYDQALIDAVERDISLVCRSRHRSPGHGNPFIVQILDYEESCTQWAGGSYISIICTLPCDMPPYLDCKLRFRLAGPRYIVCSLFDLTDVIYNRRLLAESPSRLSVGTMCGPDLMYLPRYINYYSAYGVTDFMIFIDLSTCAAHFESISQFLSNLDPSHHIYLFLVNINLAHAFRRPSSLVYDYGRMGRDQIYVYHPFLVKISQLLSSLVGCRYHAFFDLDEFFLFQGMYETQAIPVFLDRICQEAAISPIGIGISEIPSMLKVHPDMHQSDPLSGLNMFTARPRLPTNHRSTKQILVNNNIQQLPFWPSPHDLSPESQSRSVVLSPNNAGYIHYINQSRYSRTSIKGYCNKLDLHKLVRLDPFELGYSLLNIQESPSR